MTHRGYGGWIEIDGKRFPIKKWERVLLPRWSPRQRRNLETLSYQAANGGCPKWWTMGIYNQYGEFKC